MIKKILFCSFILSVECFSQYDYTSEVDLRIERKTTFTYQEYMAQGKEFHTKNEKDKALSAYKKALKIKPAEFKQCIELGNCLLRLGNSFFDNNQPDLAIQAFNAILEISPNIPAAHHNIAFTLAQEMGEHLTALTHYRKALEMNSDNIETQFCMALSLLATGNLEQGFTLYQSRWKRYEHKPRSFSNYPLPKQLNSLDVAGKRILIRVEQGLGDTLHFIRYAQLLKEKGATIIVEVQKPLAQLISLCSYIDEIIQVGDAIAPYDFQIALLNLPVLFNTTLETIPRSIPYLRADPQLIHFWRNEIATDNLFKIGLCWQGDSAHGPHKFMPLDYFEKLGQIPGVSLFSLQKNENGDSKIPSFSHIKNCSHDFDGAHGRFMDTAALMKNLDLVITVDTSIAHLAGGLGVPVWVVLPFPAEWRWLQDRNDSPWYPTMRLFRQKQFGDWESVYEELVYALKAKLREKK